MAGTLAEDVVLRDDPPVQHSFQEVASNASNPGWLGALTTLTAQGHRVAGERLPNFQQLKQSGGLLPHLAWFKREQTLSVQPADFHIKNISNPNTWLRVTNHVSTLPGSYSPPAPVLDQADYALQKAAANIYSQGWDSLTFMAELPKTANMIRNFSKKAINLSRGLSRDRVHDLWLEGRYGWRTLAYDARDIHHAYFEMDTKREIWTERQGFSLNRSNREVLVSDFPNMLYCPRTHDLQLKESVRGSISAQVTRHSQVINPVTTAWELVPYSFVLDWVYDVGTALNAMSLAAVTNNYSCSVGFRQDYKLTVTHGEPVPYSGWKEAEYGSSCTYEGYILQRIPTSLTFTPQLTNRLATPDLILDLTGLARLRGKYSSRR